MVTDLQKKPHLESDALMKWARNHSEGCQIRLPGCEWGPTCGCHRPTGARFKGLGYKPSWISLGCDYCHSIIDGRVKSDFEQDFLMMHWSDGFYATLELLRLEGHLRIFK